MNLLKKLSYTGIDCSGECKVLPPTFQGIKALVARAGGNEAVVASTFPPLDFVDDEEHSLVGEFVNELQNCDKIERVELVREFDSYVKDLRASSDGKGKRGTQVASVKEESKDKSISLSPASKEPKPAQGAETED